MDQPVPGGGHPFPGGGPPLPEGGRPEPAGDAALTGALYCALALLGAVIGLLGSFAQGWVLGTVPVAVVLLTMINFLVPWLAGRAVGTRMAAAVPAVAWAVVTSVMSVPRAEGDLIVPGTLEGYLFIIAGLVAAVIAVSLVPPATEPGSWLTRGPFAPRDRPRPARSPTGRACPPVRRP
jgi:hypothetical protein